MRLIVLVLGFSSHCVSGNNDAEEESDEDEDYVPSEDWKKVCSDLYYYFYDYFVLNIAVGDVYILDSYFFSSLNL